MSSAAAAWGDVNKLRPTACGCGTREDLRESRPENSAGVPRVNEPCRLFYARAFRMWKYVESRRVDINCPGVLGEGLAAFRSRPGIGRGWAVRN